jgi:uncharacterized protein
MNDDQGAVREVEVGTGTDGALRGMLTWPAGPVRGGIVSLHPACNGSLDNFLIRHLAAILPALGIAVLRFDRRPDPAQGQPMPLPDQAEDALAAVGLLRAHCGQVPVGLWGFGQGGWAAALAAARTDAEIAFLILVSVAGVSPARQKRYYTAQSLRRAGYGDEDVAELLELRSNYESYLRGELDLASAQQGIDAVADRPWFGLAQVERRLTPAVSWPDLDFDPCEAFGTVRCPLLLFYGEEDENLSTDKSIEQWRRIALAAAGEGVSIVRLPIGTTHVPTTGPGDDADSISPEYTRELTSWLSGRLASLASVGAGGAG